MVLQCRSWDFTANMEYYTKEQLFKLFDEYFKLWGFQGEEGEQNGYKHWQMRVRLPEKKAKSEAGIWKIFTDAGLKVPNYVAPTSDKTHGKKDFNYVIKKDTRITDTYTDKNYKSFLTNDQIYNAEYYDAFYKDPTIWKSDYLKITYDTLRPFQKQVLESGNIYDGRDINIVINHSGHMGKSTLAEYIRVGKHGIQLLIDDPSKIVMSLCDKLIESKERSPKLILFDMPKCMDVATITTFLRTIEIIKDGYISDPRNKNREWEYHKPAIWIFTNNLINLESMSADRWKIWELEDFNLDLKLLTAREYEKKCNIFNYLKKQAISDKKRRSEDDIKDYLAEQHFIKTGDILNVDSVEGRLRTSNIELTEEIKLLKKKNKGLLNIIDKSALIENNL